VDLAPALNVEALQPLLSNPDFLEKVKDFLPKGEKDEGKEITAEDLRGTVQSPQFQQVAWRSVLRIRIRDPVLF
jgi:hypothetical protein